MFDSSLEYPTFVRGIIFRNEKMCFIRERKNGKIIWNFPGGKVEQNESIYEAINREINEELGVTCLKTKLIFSGNFVFENQPWYGYYFNCKVDSYDFILESHENIFSFLSTKDIFQSEHGVPNKIIEELTWKFASCTNI